MVKQPKENALEGCPGATHKVGRVGKWSGRNIEAPMNDVEKLSIAIARTPVAHRPILRKLRFLVRPGGRTLCVVAAMNRCELADVLQTAVVSRTGSKAKNPGQTARAMLRRLRVAALANPDLELPVPLEIVPRHQIKTMAEERLPKRYREDIDALRALRRDTRGREVNGLAAIKTRTLDRYIKHLSQTLTLAEELGEEINDDFGIRRLSNVELVEKVLARLDETKSRWTVASYITPLLRSARDLFGNDEMHRSNIEYLETELVERIPNPALSAVELLQLDNMAENQLFAASLENVPEAIIERSQVSGLGVQDRLARIAAGFAVAVRLQHPSMSVDRITMFDFARHIRIRADVYDIEVPDPCSGGSRWETCSLRLVRIVRLHMAVRVHAGIEGTLAFPARKRALGSSQTPKSEYQSASHVGAFVMGEVEAVLGMRLGYRKLKTIAVHVALREFPEEAAAIAQASGIKDLNYFEQRWSPLLGRRSK